MHESWNVFEAVKVSVTGQSLGNDCFPPSGLHLTLRRWGLISMVGYHQPYLSIYSASVGR